jgi:hypothetical protein
MERHPDSFESIDAALSEIPSTFAKLVFLSGAGDDDRRTEVFLNSTSDVSAAVQHLHRQLFTAWTNATLAVQMTAVAEYFAVNAHGPVPIVADSIAQWLEEKRYERLIPPGTSDCERKLFESDMQAILRLLQIRLGRARLEHNK